MTVSRSPAHVLAPAAAPSTSAAVASPASTLLAAGHAVPFWRTAAPSARFPWPPTGVTDAHMTMAAAKALAAFPAHPATVLAARSVASAPLAAERRPSAAVSHNTGSLAGSATMSSSSPARVVPPPPSSDAYAAPPTRSHHRRDVLELLARFP
ncbi:hypothetical protein AMAG_04659 [Allomyces macrogynus ATCC 38327]|uniref:Uncharacterized protein n=1 Tax=Allomyces macrogynus (strain ATCC 38327) TaxID=578462 RepID=A0A0L0S5N0_ALLM3|nr:hypothetical protein AMAG_04659 [Allomyces macrogynus ATCC 38327]|eukprot:KNE57812.1 hypothetical protein AMAG_04659 [Allomyces macrogynus ATCC 38327]